MYEYIYEYTIQTVNSSMYEYIYEYTIQTVNSPMYEYIYEYTIQTVNSPIYEFSQTLISTLNSPSQSELRALQHAVISAHRTVMSLSLVLVGAATAAITALHAKL